MDAHYALDTLYIRLGVHLAIAKRPQSKVLYADRMDQAPRCIDKDLKRFCDIQGGDNAASTYSYSNQ